MTKGFLSKKVAQSAVLLGDWPIKVFNPYKPSVLLLDIGKENRTDKTPQNAASDQVHNSLLT